MAGVCVAERVQVFRVNRHLVGPIAPPNSIQENVISGVDVNRKVGTGNAGIKSDAKPLV